MKKLLVLLFILVFVLNCFAVTINSINASVDEENKLVLITSDCGNETTNIELETSNSLTKIISCGQETNFDLTSFEPGVYSIKAKIQGETEWTAKTFFSVNEPKRETQVPDNGLIGAVAVLIGIMFFANFFPKKV